MFELEIRTESSENRPISSDRLTLFKKIINCATEMIDQTTLKISDAGLSLQVMDSMHVAFLDIFLSGKLFNSYRCDRELMIGVPLKHFSNILKSIVLNDNSVVRMYCDDSPQTLKVQHIQSDSKYEFDINLYQIDSEKYDIPVLEHEAEVRLPAKKFMADTSVFASFGEHMTFGCKNGEFIIHQNNDLTSNSASIRPNGDSITVECEEDIDVRITTKYVNIINKVSSLSESLVIKLGNSCPLYFDISLNDEMGYLRFYIAPKLEN